MNIEQAQNDLMDEALGLKPIPPLSAPADGYSRPFGSETSARSAAGGASAELLLINHNINLKTPCLTSEKPAAGASLK